VGMQSLDNMDGLEYTFDNVYHPAAVRLSAGRAIKMTTAVGMVPPSHLAYDPGTFIVSAPVGQIASDTLNISNTGVGQLNFTIGEFVDNDRILMNGNGQTAAPVENARLSDGGQPNNPPDLLNHGGPDASGNNWVDSDDPGGPAFTWVDLRSVGTPAGISGDNGYVGPIDLGITFPFYGTNYSSVYISANGLLTFSAGSSTSANTAIPNSATPNNFLAPLWDDLSPQNGGTVLYYRDAANGRFIVSYTNAPFYTTTGGTGTASFEAILYSSGRVLYEYGLIDGGTHGLNSLTIGMENATGTDGLQVIYNAAYLHSNMAILFYPQMSWLRSSIHGGILHTDSDTLAIITFDATNLTQGTYAGHLTLESNDPDSCMVQLPVSFYVGVTGPTCNYVVGDVNNSSSFTGLDVTYTVRFFKGGPLPPYSCECTTGNTWYVEGDVNGSCTFSGLDVTMMVRHFKSGSAVFPCPVCPPGGILAPINPEPVPTPAVRPLLTPSSNAKPVVGSAE
jgi:hypothetical protein